jgi:arylsulfatase A-like enzyme
MNNRHEEVHGGLTRRTVLRSLLAAPAGPAVLRGVRRPTDKPNLLFLWADEHRADTMAVYGNPRFHVPAMNRLGAESIVFDRCYVTQPVCTPSRSSVMTGLWPHTTGCVANNIPLPRDAKILPEFLANAAYHTAYMGKWHLGDGLFSRLCARI